MANDAKADYFNMCKCRDRALEFENSGELVRVDENKKSMLKLCDLIYVKTLGSGSFGEVKVAKHKVTGGLYAVKIMENLNESQPLYESIRNEENILSTIKHPNVLQMFCYKNLRTVTYIVLELYTRGTLRSYVIHDLQLTESEIKRCAWQMCSATTYLKSINIAHRDIKLNNYLLDEHLNVKLCDFGLAVRCLSQKLKDRVGTLGYASPQVAQYDYNPFKADVFALGVCFYYMFNKTKPISVKSFAEMAKIKLPYKVIWPLNMSDACQDLIESMLEYEEKKRFKIEQVMEHLWFEEFKENKAEAFSYLGECSTIDREEKDCKEGKNKTKAVVKSTKNLYITSNITSMEIFEKFFTKNEVVKTFCIVLTIRKQLIIDTIIKGLHNFDINFTMNGVSFSCWITHPQSIQFGISLKDNFSEKSITVNFFKHCGTKDALYKGCWDICRYLLKLKQ